MMRFTILALAAVTAATAHDDPKLLFQQGVEMFKQSAALAQQGKFSEASAVMQEGMATMDAAVALAPDRLDIRLMRGMAYGSMPPFLNKAATAREDLEAAVRHPDFGLLPPDRRERALSMLNRLAAPPERPDRFPRVNADTSPVIAAASITLPGSQPGKAPAAMERIMKQLEGYPGLLGKHMVASIDHPGMFIVFTWWKNKQALNDWFYGDLHQSWIRERGRAISGESKHPAAEVPTQVAMEVFAGLPGGVQVGGGFIPAGIFAAGRQ